MTIANPLFINTILLGGHVRDKLAAASRAGFAEVELWRQDVIDFADAPAALTERLTDVSLGLTDYQVLLDFDGAADAHRDEKRREAIDMLDQAVELGAKTVLTPANTQTECVAERIEEDLGWLCTQAAARGIRIAYEAMAWSTVNHFVPDAWQTIRNVGASNLGMVIDAFHIFTRGRTAADIQDIPAERIYLVQLSDLTSDRMPDLNHNSTCDHALDGLVDTARHHRLLPGEGHFPLIDLIDAVLAKGYRGPIGLEVFNDALKAGNPDDTAKKAMKALQRILTGTKVEKTACSHIR